MGEWLSNSSNMRNLMFEARKTIPSVKDIKDLVNNSMSIS